MMDKPAAAGGHYKDVEEAQRLSSLVEGSTPEGRILRDLAASRYVCTQPSFALQVRATLPNVRMLILLSPSDSLTSMRRAAGVPAIRAGPPGEAVHPGVCGAAEMPNQAVSTAV